MRILIVEDDRKVAALMKRGLEAERYEVHAVRDGEEVSFFTSIPSPSFHHHSLGHGALKGSSRYHI